MRSRGCGWTIPISFSSCLATGAEAELQALATTLGLNGHILFAGARTDAWSWLKAAEIFASTSAWEGHPNAVLEAAAAGVPMLLSDLPPHRDAAGGGATYVDAEDSGALASALSALLENRGKARRLAAAARERVRPLTLARAADAYAEIYRKAAAGLLLQAASTA